MAASRIAASAARRASRWITRAISQTRTPSDPRKTVKTHDKTERRQEQSRRQHRHAITIQQVGEEAVADVIDLASDQIDDGSRPLGGKRRLPEPVHLPVELATQRRGGVADELGDQGAPGLGDQAKQQEERQRTRE